MAIDILAGLPMSRRVYAFSAWLSLVIAPELASACAVCFGGEDDNRQAFIDTTVILTIVPLLLIAAFIWLMVRRIQKVESQRQADLAQDRQALAEIAVPPSGT
jgi:hypothetical protein